MNLGAGLPLYTKTLLIITLQTVLISFIFSLYHIEIPITPATNWIVHKIKRTPFCKSLLRRLGDVFGNIAAGPSLSSSKQTNGKRQATVDLLDNSEGLPVFTTDQLALFDGTRSSNPVYLAILGRVYNVEKGRKHYAPPGGYSFFSGRDASRAFVTGDFTPTGLTDDIRGLTESELLSIVEWIGFYEKEYELVGLLEGLYWTAEGKPTARNLEVNKLIARAAAWKEKQLQESEVFPPCNSEWQKESGGKVWCTNKSGGIKRDWVGVPRRLFLAKDKSFRCACVKNFGASLSSPDSENNNRGDLDNPSLKEYDNCSPNSNSCRLPSRQ